MFAIVTPMDCDQNKELFLGRWINIEDAELFDHNIDLEIFNEDTILHVRLNDRRYSAPPVARIKWVSSLEWNIEYPNWISDTKVVLKGVFDNNFERLSIQIHGDGMTGLQEYGSELQKYAPLDGKRFEAHSFKYLKPKELQDDSSQLHGLREKARQMSHSDSHSEPQLDGLLVMKDGEVLLESYYGRMHQHTLHMISSCTKSIMAIVVGIAIDQGLVELDDIVSESFDYTPSWSSQEPIRLRHLLSMTAGLSQSDLVSQNLLQCDNIEEFILSSPQLTNPGTQYDYDNRLPALLGPYLEKKIGISIEKFVDTYLFKPLNITTYRWTRVRQTSINGTQSILTAGGLYLRVRDMVKIGQLMLGNGVYCQKRIISSRYVELSVKQHTAQSQYPYGFYWHLSNQNKYRLGNCDGYIALGQGEQIVAIVPSQDLVVAAVSSSWHYDHSNREYKVLELLNETLLRVDKEV